MATKKPARKVPARKQPRSAFADARLRAVDLQQRAKLERNGTTALALRVEALEVLVAELVAAAQE